MGGTIGFFASGGLVFILSTLLPDLSGILTNPIVFMVLCVIGVFIGGSIAEKGRLTISDVKEAVKGGVSITLGWFAIWIGFGLVIMVFVLFLKALNFLPRNY